MKTFNELNPQVGDVLGYLSSLSPYKVVEKGFVKHLHQTRTGEVIGLATNIGGDSYWDNVRCWTMLKRAAPPQTSI